METAYLKEYVVLAHRNSFTAAARELHVTQSTLSKHIAALEREFKTDLFIRDRNGIKLTSAGEILLAQAIKIDDLFSQTHKALHPMQAKASIASNTGTTLVARNDAIRDTALRCKCADLAKRSNLTQLEVGALILYMEERGLEEIQRELELTRDEVADLLGSVYRKLDIYSKQEILDLIHSISE